MNFLTLQDIIVMGIGCLALLLWLILFFVSRKYNSLFDNLTEKEFPLKEIYGTGYAIMEMISYKYKGKYDRKLRTSLSVLYEEKYVEYYLRVIYAQSLSIAMLIFLCSFILYGLSREIAILFVCIMMAGVIVYYYMTLAEQKIQKRSDVLLSDFSEIVSQLALLINAGMILREAWKEVAYAGEGIIYEEMCQTYEEMQNGISEVEAVRRFGVRCIIPEIKKFSTTIIQGIEKGNRDLAMMLQAQSDEVWAAKQQRVKRLGEQANTKLMVPMFIMFVGILIMVVIPIFTNLGV